VCKHEQTNHSLIKKKTSWNPFVQTVKVPSMGDINERLSWISSERMKKDVIDNKVDLFLKPPVDCFGTLNYDKFGKF
jgi:lysophospholipid hydrolase